MDEDLRLYAVLRSNISMSDGKAIAQAGHAYVDTLLDAFETDPERARSYASLKPGTKIALEGGSEHSLHKLHELCRASGTPCHLIVDHGHVELPDFDGSEVLTALGVGPIDRKTARRLLSKFKLWRGKGGGS